MFNRPDHGVQVIVFGQVQVLEKSLVTTVTLRVLLVLCKKYEDTFFIRGKTMNKEILTSILLLVLWTSDFLLELLTVHDLEEPLPLN